MAKRSAWTTSASPSSSSEALTSQHQSLTIRRELGDRHGQAISLDDLGVTLLKLGRHQEALTSLHDGLTLFREIDDQPGRAEALRNLGDALLTVGQPQQARQTWQEALQIYQALHLPETDQIRSRLATLPPQAAIPARDRADIERPPDPTE